MANPDFAKKASGPSQAYDTSAMGMGIAPTYLAFKGSTTAAPAAAATGSADFSSGLFAARPQAGDAPFSFFFATDREILYFSSGDGWLRVSRNN